MTIGNLHRAVNTPCFTTQQLVKLFYYESPSSINMQLARFEQRGEVIRLRRGLYVFANQSPDDFVIANTLYPHSYVSLESALNAYGVIPDVPAQVTSVTPLTTKLFDTPLGSFSYSKIMPALFFGFGPILSSNQDPTLYYQLAEPEKALLDFIYVRKIHNLESSRVDITSLNLKRLTSYARSFPKWVQKVIKI